MARAATLRAPHRRATPRPPHRRSTQRARWPDRDAAPMPRYPTIDANPYRWPYDGDLRPDNTALVVIDMQTDFCGIGGYVDKMGYDLALTRAPIEPIRRLMT